jgi:hypothetical protein
MQSLALMVPHVLLRAPLHAQAHLPAPAPTTLPCGHLSPRDASWDAAKDAAIGRNCSDNDAQTGFFGVMGVPADVN